MTETTAGPRAGRWGDAWATRPARSRQDRKVAGVAAALARRYAVDPVLVRVAFVAAAFYGPGIPLYLLGCVVLPDGDRPARGRAAIVLTSVLVVGAAGLLALVLFGPDGGWVAPLLVCLGLLAALHVTRGDLGRGTEPLPAHSEMPGAEPAAGSGPSTAVVGGTDGFDGADGSGGADGIDGAGDSDGADGAGGADDAGGRDGTDGTTTVPVPAAPVHPPAWDPLGAAPFAWDLPEPGQDAAPAEPTSRITPVTLGLAVLAAAAVAVVALTIPGGLAPATVPATALAVVGAGLVIGSFRRAGRWLLPVAIVFGVATWLAGAVPWADLDRGVGTIAEAPRSVAAVAPEYVRGVGDVALDLSGLDLRGTPSAPAPTVRTRAHVGVGSVVVVVPPDADVLVRGSSGLGDVTVGDQTRDGTSAALTVDDPGPDGPGGGRIELDASTGLGSVVVSRD